MAANVSRLQPVTLQNLEESGQLLRAVVLGDVVDLQLAGAHADALGHASCDERDVQTGALEKMDADSVLEQRAKRQMLGKGPVNRLAALESFPVSFQLTSDLGMDRESFRQPSSLLNDLS